MKIIFIGENDIILNDIHITNKHKGKKMKKLVVNIGYLWKGYSYDIKKIIKKCPICNNTHSHKKLKSLLNKSWMRGLIFNTK